MTKFCALLAVTAAAAFCTPSLARAQYNPPVIIGTSYQTPVVGTVVYDTWGGDCCTTYGRVVYHSYYTPCQPVYATQYSTAPCSNVSYYYVQSCWQPARRTYSRCGW